MGKKIKNLKAKIISIAVLTTIGVLFQNCGKIDKNQLNQETAQTLEEERIYQLEEAFQKSSGTGVTIVSDKTVGNERTIEFSGSFGSNKITVDASDKRDAGAIVAECGSFCTQGDGLIIDGLRGISSLMPSGYGGDSQSGYIGIRAIDSPGFSTPCLGINCSGSEQGFQHDDGDGK
jgi:hypothetical protein